MNAQRDGMPAPPAGWGRIEWAEELHERTRSEARRQPGLVASRTRWAAGPELPADRAVRLQRKAA